MQSGVIRYSRIPFNASTAWEKPFQGQVVLVDHLSQLRLHLIIYVCFVGCAVGVLGKSRQVIHGGNLDLAGNLDIDAHMCSACSVILSCRIVCGS